MTKTIVIRAKSKMTSGPSGMGVRIIHGEMTIVPTREAVHCSDIGFNSIKGLLFEQNSNGSQVVTKLIGPGSYDNYASLQVYDGAGTNRLRVLGTLKVNFLALGE
jgi:hypothetical protein